MSTTALPTGSREIIEHLCQMFPHLFVNDDEQQRQLTIKIGEQFAFVFGPRWGNKVRAGLSDAMRSKDSIAVQEDDGTTSVWDMFSSGLAILVNDGDLPVAGSHANLPPSDARFIPCTPTNHLGGDPLPGETPDPPDADDDDEILAALLRLEHRVEAVEQENEALRARVARHDAELAKPMQGQVVGRTGDKYAHSHPFGITVDVYRVG